LTGPRGSGKTVLLNALEDTARAAGWIVVSDSVHPGLIDDLTNVALPALLAHYDSGKTASHVTGVSAGVLGVSASVSRSVTDLHPAGVSFRSQLTELATLAGNQGQGVFLALDEVHRGELKDLEVLFHALQHAFREGLPVAFAGAGLASAIQSLLSTDGLTFLRRARRYPLGDVARPLVAVALREPIALAGRSISDAAIDLALDAVQGYPFLIQVVGYELWAVDPATATIDVRQARTALPRAAEAARQLVFEPIMADLSEVDRRFLRAMADDPADPTPVTAIVARLGVSRAYASRYRARLIEAEVIEPAERGHLRFAVPFFREYLRSTAT
jgi:hypothetical protein